MKVLVLGGYGHFGSVIARKLADDAAFEVVVAGRDPERARRFASEIGANAACLDTDAPGFARDLERIAPELVISTAGPFQGQGYRVAHAAIDIGAHYVDIADGRDFVCGIVALDVRARERDVLVASGASSVPALSSAVVDRLAPEFAALREIEIGISSSERPPGLATVRAVLGNCGRPIPQWRGGAWSTTHGWQSLRRHEFRGAPMARWLCDCDVPDVSLFPARYPSVSSVRFGAGVELSIAHLGLWMLSGLRRIGLAPDLRPFALPLMRAAGAFRFMGTGRSAMFVRLRGTGPDGREMVLDWELVAEGNEGMNVPCMAAVALARKLAAGELPATGAMPCVGLVSLEEYLAELSGLKIKVTGATGAGSALKNPAP